MYGLNGLTNAIEKILHDLCPKMLTKTYITVPISTLHPVQMSTKVKSGTLSSNKIYP